MANDDDDTATARAIVAEWWRGDIADLLPLIDAIATALGAARQAEAQRQSFAHGNVGMHQADACEAALANLRERAAKLGEHLAVHVDDAIGPWEVAGTDHRPGHMKCLKEGVAGAARHLAEKLRALPLCEEEGRDDG